MVFPKGGNLNKHHKEPKSKIERILAQQIVIKIIVRTRAYNYARART
nr:hypothetical protein DXGOKGYL_DXGOKGYL_CDS_0004 [Microvirus sp.]